MSLSRISTYTDLVNAIPIWLNRQDLADVAPLFVSLGEQEMNRVLRVRQMVRRATTVVRPEDDGFVALPADYLEAEAFEAQTSPPRILEVITPPKADRKRVALKEGPLRYFTIIGNQIEFVPHPAEEVTVELSYYARVPPLGPSTQTNWLLANHPDIYLYNSLAHSAAYLKDDARIATWRLAVDKFIEDAREADSRAVYGLSTPKTRPRRAF